MIKVKVLQKKKSVKVKRIDENIGEKGWVRGGEERRERKEKNKSKQSQNKQFKTFYGTLG